MRKNLLNIAAAVLLCTGPAIAGTVTFDFNTNPDGILDFTGNIYDGPVGSRTLADAWHPTGGVGDSGYLSITDATTGTRSKIIFDDFDNGQIVQAFTFEADLRIGDGTDAPADGFSINYARANDPVLTGGNFAGNQDCEANLPEEGTQTGIGIGFDAWNSGSGSSCNVIGPQIGPDVRAVTVRVDGILVLQYATPTANGLCADPTSLQTGPRGDGSATTLCWAHLKVDLDTAGMLNVWWKGVQILSNFQTTYFPSAGRLIFAGRTGGSTQNQHVDNIKITTIPAADILVGGGAATPIGVSITAQDSGNSLADTNTAVMQFDDVVVPATYVVKTNATAYFAFWDVTKPLVAGSTHTVALSIKDNAGKTVAKTNTVTVPPYVVIPEAYAAANVDTTKPGFAVRAHFAPNGAPGTLGYEMESTIARAEQQLAGLRGANILAGSVAGQTLSTTATGVINYSFDVNTDGSLTPYGYFHTNEPAGGPTDWPDSTPWGIDPAQDTSNIAAAFETYIYFPEAGVYTLIFNSDDGFRTTSSPNPSETLHPLLVSEADGGRGSTDSPATLYIAKAGFYPFRTVWFQGGGGANLEWSASQSLPTIRARHLINDLVNADALKSYSARVANTMPAAVSFVNPAVNSGGPWLPNLQVQLELTDGASPVTPGSIVLKLDDVAVTPVLTPSGNKTKVTYQPPSMLASGSTHTVAIAFAAGGVNYAATNTFAIVGYVQLPPSLAIPAAAVDVNKPGFLIKTHQADYQLDNTVIARGNYQMDGLIGWPNVADLTAFTGPQGYFETQPNGIMYIDFNDSDSAGFFPYSLPVPGIPGTAAYESGHGSYSQEVLTVLDLQPGFYCMGVASDDGSQVTFGNPKEKYSLSINVCSFNGGRGIGDTGSDKSYFYVSQAGKYPARLMWYEGGGGSGAEWYFHDIVPAFSSAATGIRRLISADPNDVVNGNVLGYQYPIDNAAVNLPYVATYGPAQKGLGNHTAYNAPVSATLVDGSGNINPASVTLAVDGVSVTPTVDKVSGVTSVKYQPASNWGPGDHTVALKFGDRTVNWTFTITTSAITTPTYWVEAEDFDFGGGQTVAAASQMPYLGGAYASKDGVSNIDYKRGDNADGAGNKFYRNVLPVPRVPEQFNENDRDRGGLATWINYRLGWIGGDQWYNYSRTVPAGKYHVYAAASNGSTAGQAHGEYALLRRVIAGQGTVNQDTEVVGIFDGPATGGWGLNTWVPLKDLDGNLVAFESTGNLTTFRYDLPVDGTSITVAGKTGTALGGNGDWDYMVFVPVAAGQPTISKVEVSGNNIVITWTNGGTLEWAPAVNAASAAWTSTGASGGTYSEPISTAGSKFYRVKQ